MKNKKRPITLLEIMIVIFLISLIGSVIGYNMKGSLDKGKAFKTEQAISQLEDIFQLEAAKGMLSHKEIAEQAESVLENSGLIKQPSELLKDGWGNPFIIKATAEGFKIYSKKYDDYLTKHSTKNKKQTVNEEQERQEEEAK